MLVVNVAPDEVLAIGPEVKIMGTGQWTKYAVDAPRSTRVMRGNLVRKLLEQVGEKADLENDTETVVAVVSVALDFKFYDLAEALVGGARNATTKQRECWKASPKMPEVLKAVGLL